MPERDKEVARRRALWSGTITFGLVSIPVDLLSALRARRTSMRMVDTEGRALGREYVCPADDKTLTGDDIVRGYETDDGRMVVVTDEELDAIAPELSRDIELIRFVPMEQIAPSYYLRPYFLVPAGRSVKAYHLLAQTMAQTRRVGIGSFVMRGHEYLVAILSDGGLLRAHTLRFADELRSPEDAGLPARPKVAQKRVRAFVKAIDALRRDELDFDELADRYAASIEDLVAAKKKKDRGVVELIEDEEASGTEEAGGAEVIDLMARLRQRLSAQARVTTADDKRVETAHKKGGTNTEKRRSARADRKHGARADKRPGAGRKKDAPSDAKTRSGKSSPAALGKLSKAELYERAGRLDIPGRSRMDKAELVEAIRSAG